MFGMKEEYVLQNVRVDDFIAEQIEREANRMPPSFQKSADLLRAHARHLRESGDRRIISILKNETTSV